LHAVDGCSTPTPFGGTTVAVHRATLACVPTAKTRVQVTVDDDLAQALDAIDPKPASRSRLIRDLALRGAAAVRASREQETQAVRVLLGIADGLLDYDLPAAGALAASRGDRLT
jgi:hypothetical protein